MSAIGDQCPTWLASFPVEWPLVSNISGTSKDLPKHVTKGTRKRKTKRHRNRLGTRQPRLQVTHALTADQETQTDEKRTRERDTSEIVHTTRATSVGRTNEIIPEPAKTYDAVPNILESLDRDEAKWLAEEVNQVNKGVFRAEKTAEKLKNTNDAHDKKASLDALQNLLKDLRRNIRYPDDETARDLDTLDEASSNFGVQNMMNYLSLLDGYFNELQRQLDK